MKNNKRIIPIFLFSCFLIPGILTAGTETTSSVAATTNTAEAKEASVLINRLEVIKAMDKSMMSSSDKKNLRKEVRSIRQQLREKAGGVYLSVGAIIIIILLLILLL